MFDAAEGFFREALKKLNMSLMTGDDVDEVNFDVKKNLIEILKTSGKFADAMKLCNDSLSSSLDAGP